ncbi:MAG: hypothetical protein HKN72_05800 [Gemmatimonadetes bacterium]|nr:hypothetical protein [Gemmatimonadota bacterium]NNF12713.1 hypothetical protein [Gemmatimonadota bacterium]NNL30637.1 hypothetical protein [Gemmatimonadota bacterium]
MPVFTRYRDGVLVLTVDGDFTANELHRVAHGAFQDDATPQVVPVLLDMSGAAGLSAKSSEELKAMGSTFGAHRERIAGLAVVASSAVHDLFAEEGHFGGEAGMDLMACTAHADAREWLSTQA